MKRRVHIQNRRPSDPASIFAVRLGEVIQDLRVSRGWTQEQFGARIGMDRSNLAHLERGIRNNLPAYHLLQIAKALDVPIDWIIRETNKPRAPGRLRSAKSYVSPDSGELSSAPSLATSVSGTPNDRAGELADVHATLAAIKADLETRLAQINHIEGKLAIASDPSEQQETNTIGGEIRE